MKKIIIIFLIILISIPILAQQTERIIELKGFKKDVIFDKSLYWFYDNFASMKVIEIKDKEQGKIIGNINVPYVIVIATVNMNTKVTIDIKDDKVRIIFIPIYVNMFPSSIGIRDYSNDDLKAITKKYKIIVDSFESYLKSKNKDW